MVSIQLEVIPNVLSFVQIMRMAAEQARQQEAEAIGRFVHLEVEKLFAGQAPSFYDLYV